MRIATEQFIKRRCGCRAIGECMHNVGAELKALDTLVDLFSLEMKRKLRRKMGEGKSGWDDPDWQEKDIIAQLIIHVDKGDMVDVANFAMFKWNRS